MTADPASLPPGMRLDPADGGWILRWDGPDRPEPAPVAVDDWYRDAAEAAGCGWAAYLDARPVPDPVPPACVKELLDTLKEHLRDHHGRRLSGGRRAAATILRLSERTIGAWLAGQQPPDWRACELLRRIIYHDRGELAQLARLKPREPEETQ